MPDTTSLTDPTAAARLAALLDSAMDAIITVDEAQSIVFYNRAAERIFGWSVQQVRGMSLDQLIPERYRAGHAGHVRRFGATGTTSRRMSGSTVVYGRRASGEEFPVDASISQLDTPEGKLFTVILRDVTERVRAETEQARLTARLTGLLDSAMDGIITVDAAQRIVLYNRAAEKIFGWPQAEVMGQPLEMLLPERYRGGHAAHVRSVRHHRRHLAPHGRRHASSTACAAAARNSRWTPRSRRSTRPEGKLFTVILRDVTERVRAQQDLAAFAAAGQRHPRAGEEPHRPRAARRTGAVAHGAEDGRDLAARAPARRIRPQAAAKLEAMLALLDTSVAATRRIAADLRPLVLDDLGLVPAIEWLVQNFTQRSGVPCDARRAGGHRAGRALCHRRVPHGAGVAGQRRQACPRDARSRWCCARDARRDPARGAGRRRRLRHRRAAQGRSRWAWRGCANARSWLQGALEIRSRAGEGTRVRGRHSGAGDRREPCIVIRLVIADDHAIVREGLKRIVGGRARPAGRRRGRRRQRGAAARARAGVRRAGAGPVDARAQRHGADQAGEGREARSCASWC